MKQKYPYRAFVCYAHQDNEIARSVVDALKQASLIGLLDKHIRRGTNYFQEIQEFIQSAHLFAL